MILVGFVTTMPQRELLRLFVFFFVVVVCSVCWFWLYLLHHKITPHFFSYRTFSYRSPPASSQTKTSFFFCLFRAAPGAYRGSHARDLIGAVDAGPHHNYSKAGSEPHLWPTPQLTATPILNPLSQAREQTRILLVPSQIRFRCATMETPFFFFWPHLWHGKIPRPETEPTPQL